jgi:hypothetical protein
LYFTLSHHGRYGPPTRRRHLHAAATLFNFLIFAQVSSIVSGIKNPRARAHF